MASQTSIPFQPTLICHEDPHILIGVSFSTSASVLSLLQDSHEREFINCDSYLESILGRSRIRFSDVPQLLQPLLHPPDPIVIQHIISVDPADAKKQACYDIVVITHILECILVASTVLLGLLYSNQFMRTITPMV